MGIQVPEEMDLFLHRESGGDTSWASGYLWGAMAAFGVMGMAETIRARWWRFVPCTCRVVDYSAPPLHCSGCPHYDGPQVTPCPTCQTPVQRHPLTTANMRVFCSDACVAADDRRSTRGE